MDVVGSQGFKGVILALPIEKVGIRSADVIGCRNVAGRDSCRNLQGLNREQTVYACEWQRAQEDAVDQAEDGGGGSDAESEGDDRGDCETGVAAELAESEGEIRHECGEHGRIMAALCGRE